MKKRVLPIIFTEAELDLVKQLLEAGGYRSMSEVVRLAIRKMHEKKFASYIYKRAMPTEGGKKLTHEQTCTDVLGGIVIEENGIKYCRIIEGAITTDKPLSLLE